MIKKASFLNSTRPLLVDMIQEETLDGMSRAIMNGLYSGAEAFGIQLCCLLPEYRNEDTLKRAFALCDGRPIYITVYKAAHCKNSNDDELSELLLLGLHCGATLCDVRGDMFCPETNQLTFDETAVNKQRILIDKIHADGGEVLMSSHLTRFFDEEDIVKMAYEQCSRGVDIVKIVSIANSEDEQMASLNIIHRLKKELDRPFLFLVGGKYTRLVRQIGPALGVCMYLCVDRYYNGYQTLFQPRLDVMKTVRDGMLL